MKYKYTSIWCALLFTGLIVLVLYITYPDNVFFLIVGLVIAVPMMCTCCPVFIIELIHEHNKKKINEANESQKKQESKTISLEDKKLELELEKQKLLLERDKLKLQGQQPQQGAIQYCKYCGAKIDRDIKQCPNCKNYLD